jgi:hypothetical protein
LGNGRRNVVKGHLTAKRAMLIALAVSIAALIGAPGAVADGCVPEDGWVCGVTAPPVPPDQAGNPQPVTIDWQQIPDAPPYVTVPMPVYAAPKACKAKHRHNTPHAKKCKKKRK